MNMLIVIILLVTTFHLNLTLAGPFRFQHKTEVSWMACSDALGKLALFSHPDEKQNQNFCNPNNHCALGSISHCMIDHAADSIEEINQFLKSCEGSGLTLEQFEHAYLNATPYMKTRNPPKNEYALQPTYFPLSVPQNAFTEAYNQAYGSILTANYTLIFGILLESYWFIIMMLATINHWVYFFTPTLIRNLHSPVVNYFRSIFILAPTDNKHHANPIKKFMIFRMLLPLRFESFIISFWFILMIIFASADIYTPTGGTIHLSIGHRAGWLVAYTLPIIFLFSGRNNFLQYLTGWQFSRFLILHRWVARSAILLIIVHASNYTMALKHFGVYKEFFQQGFVIAGVTAGTAIGLLNGHSFQIFRNSNYELFVLIHILLATAVVVGGWIHTSHFDCPQFFYATITIWGVDKLARIVRIISFGIQTAQVELRAEETIKVSVKKPHHWKAHPGAHSFIYFFKPTCFWQAHPFTVVDSICDENTITSYIKVKGGMTHGLFKHLLKCPDNKDHIKVLVEGPYSSKLPLQIFDTVVFLAGGNGIPGLFAEALDLYHKSNGIKHIKIYWVIREFKCIDWFYDELKRAFQCEIEIIIYITRAGSLDFDFTRNSFENSEPFEKSHVRKPTNSTKDNTTIENSLTNSSFKESLNFIEFREGRPNLQQIIDFEILCCKGPIAFATCAHPSMVDDVRVSVIKALRSDCSKRIELFDELQRW
ncbi:FAD-binding domain-containing protein [Scheffersomyces amazonensis]|uniref:FAD-binding domain-containing protein n=1 Tax=Scheffersomyces amazonensis TaxID=1078765 RepID=UPI00315D8C37